jgi:hypothetical protein
MDLRAHLRSVAPVTGRQFAAFRIAFGLYLAVHFAHLIPWGRELFSREGVLADATLNPTFGVLPNLLALVDTPAGVTAFLLILTACSVLFTVGVARRTAALVLWYGWACLFNRNVLISNPSIAYVGLLLLLTTLVPATEPWRVTRALRWPRGEDNGETGDASPTAPESFYMPAAVFFTAWFLMATGYAFSGVIKLFSPSWADGTALWHVVNNPLARTGPMRDLMLLLPAWAFRLLTWQALALEILFLPLALWRVTRPVAWLAMVGMHLGIMLMVSFADLSAGMVLLHAFTFDARWVPLARIARRRVRRRAQVVRAFTSRWWRTGVVEGTA